MRPWIIECEFSYVKDHSVWDKGKIWGDDGIGNWGVGDGNTQERECLILKETGKDW